MPLTKSNFLSLSHSGIHR